MYFWGISLLSGRRPRAGADRMLKHSPSERERTYRAYRNVGTFTKLEILVKVFNVPDLSLDSYIKLLYQEYFAVESVYF